MSKEKEEARKKLIEMGLIQNWRLPPAAKRERDEKVKKALVALSKTSIETEHWHTLMNALYDRNPDLGEETELDLYEKRRAAALTKMGDLEGKERFRQALLARNGHDPEWTHYCPTEGLVVSTIEARPVDDTAIVVREETWPNALKTSALTFVMVLLFPFLWISQRMREAE